ncbi:MAG TPA: hypothetical protein VHE35_11965 [Kofleriaceae bacterium]|nr:hypothetical protein [Kofleriaceae bacterium]
MRLAAAVAAVSLVAAPAVARAERPLPSDLAAPAAPTRPTGTSLGLGIGWSVPAQALSPDLVGVRLRTAGGLVLEPVVSITHDRSTTDDGTTRTADVLDAVDLALVVREPVARRGRVELSVLAAADLRRTVSDPDGDDNSQTDSTWSVGYGLALDYWPGRHWDLSLDATNPIYTSTSATRDNGTGVPPVSTDETRLGLVFDPTVTVMIHLFL